MDEPRSEIDWRAVQTMQFGMSAFVVFVMVVIWAATGFGYFWPIWVWFGLAIPVAFQYAIRRSLDGPAPVAGALGPRRAVLRGGRDPDVRLGAHRVRLLAVLAAVRAGGGARAARADDDAGGARCIPCASAS